MPIVIDIDENLYSYISKEDAVYFPDDGGELFDAVKNGTPLDKIRAEIENTAYDWQEIDGEHESRMVVDLNDALEIIDKYKAESEKE